MPQAAVAMFCGPHDEGDRIPTRRIDHAIEIARRLEAPLIIAGDAFHGAEVLRFRDRALTAGVRSALTAYDSRCCTLADAQAVSRLIVRGRLESLDRFHLVTDWWHMERASLMLGRELKRIVGRQILVVPESVMTGPDPDAAVHHNERLGIEDYLAGRYGTRRVVDPLCHRPQLSL